MSESRAGKHLIAALTHKRASDILSVIESRGSATVAEIHTILKMDQPVCSHHLRKLKRFGLVNVYESGRYRYYSINEDRLNAARKLISDINKFASNK